MSDELVIVVWRLAWRRIVCAGTVVLISSFARRRCLAVHYAREAKSFDGSGDRSHRGPRASGQRDRGPSTTQRLAVVGGLIGMLLALAGPGIAAKLAQVIFVGREFATASPDALVLERWRLGHPVPGRRCEYSSSRILDVRAIGPDLAANKGFWRWTPHPNAPSVAFDYDGKTVFLAPGLGGVQADRVVQALKQVLLPVPR